MIILKIIMSFIIFLLIPELIACTNYWNFD